MSDEPRAIVIGHADFAAGLVSAVVQITGRPGMLVSLSNAGLSAEEITRRLREAIDTHRIAVVFTDLPAGSATVAARRISRDVPLTIVSGTSLPVLLEFVMQVGDTPPGATARQAAERGKTALIVSES